MTLDAASRQRSAPPRAPRRLLPGLVLAVVVAGVATGVGHLLPLLGAPVAGILLGALLSGRVRRYPALRPGTALAAGFVLQLAVVVLGSQLSLGGVARVGLSSLPVMLGTLTVCLAAAHLLGRRMGIDADLRTLIGVGTSICGASAIAAVSPVIRARNASVAYAMTTIFCFNVAAVLLFPPLGHLLHLSQDAFGLFAGTAVNDTSSVVAAATAYGPQAADHAVVVKLVRTLMIIPVCLVLGVLAGRRGRAGAGAPAAQGVARRTLRLVPWFLVGFLLVATANSVGLVPGTAQPPLRQASVFLITTALAAIGMSTDLAGLRRTGSRPVLLGGMLWLLVTGTSLLLQWSAG
ncbi:MAG TPA: putative sulfate exporter family transporter [Marmoricola sp.]|nr:putative sulfate exporter family transporter [Marmoricola sp.]